MPAQIHATPPKPDQELPLPLPPKGVLPVPSTTPPQEGDDKRILVATSIAQDEDMPAASPAQSIAASGAEHAQILAQIHATSPKPDQQLPSPLPPQAGPPVASTTPPQQGDDKRIPVATSTAQDEDMPAASPIAASAAEHAQMPAAMLVKQAETVPCQRPPPPPGLDTEDAATGSCEFFADHSGCDDLVPDFNEGREDDEDIPPPPLPPDARESPFSFGHPGT